MYYYIHASVPVKAGGTGEFVKLTGAAIVLPGLYERRGKGEGKERERGKGLRE